jgi:hypothetical protein
LWEQVNGENYVTVSFTMYAKFVRVVEEGSRKVKVCFETSREDIGV